MCVRAEIIYRLSLVRVCVHVCVCVVLYVSYVHVCV